MKTKDVDFITSNEQHVRMRIFDGSLALSEAGAELLRIEKAQHECTRRERDEWMAMAKFQRLAENDAKAT